MLDLSQKLVNLKLLGGNDLLRMHQKFHIDDVVFSLLPCVKTSRV
jgi:hypothetical protein